MTFQLIYRPLLGLMMMLCLGHSLPAATLIVTNTANGGLGSLRQALADAQENDTITFAPDVRGTIALAPTGALRITKSITIQGPGANVLAMDARLGAFYASRVLFHSSSREDCSDLGYYLYRWVRRSGRWNLQSVKSDIEGMYGEEKLRVS